MLTIVIDEKSIIAQAVGQLELETISTALQIPASTQSTKCVEVDGHGYVLSRRFQPSDALLVISLAADGPLTSLSVPAREHALERIFKSATLFIARRSRAIPLSWRAFHAGNLLSFQADRLARSAEGGRTDAGRVILEFTQEIGPRIYACFLEREGELDLASFQPNRALMKAALAGVPKALAHHERAAAPDKLGNQVALDDYAIARGDSRGTYLEWYSARLTKAQRTFVDFPLPASVRLTGPAGSGKTLALVVKCLMEIHKDKEKQKRVLFLTHAISTAEAIEGMVQNMDPEGLELLASDRPALTVTTLQNLANGMMRYNLDSLTPVSLDGHQGRVVQAEILNDVIEDFRRGDWITYRAQCSAPFVTYMESPKDSTQRQFFLYELLNEFACVLDAEGVRSGTERRDQYLSERRKSWMLLLLTKEERTVVLRLYDSFRAWLRAVNAIGSDQMISDFLAYLGGFKWEAIREKDGYDAVFVDELHLFNRQERMVFRQLLRNPDQIPTVLMAYDAKQSPRDSFLGLPKAESQAYDLWRDARLGKVEKIELVEIFRYTPQIVKAVKCFDQAFPGQDLDEEWPAYSGIAKIADGPVPVVCALASTLETYSSIFPRASEMQKKLANKGRVALLCASNESFKRFLKLDDLKSYYHLVDSRDDASSIPVSKRKFIFSMPEYVAGLQFDTVLLVEVNLDEVPAGPYAAAALRKFASQVYLGASRAERRLEIYASTEHGGIAPLVSQAVLAKAVEQVEKAKLPTF